MFALSCCCPSPQECDHYGSKLLFSLALDLDELFCSRLRVFAYRSKPFFLNFTPPSLHPSPDCSVPLTFASFAKFHFTPLSPHPPSPVLFPSVLSLCTAKKKGLFPSLLKTARRSFLNCRSSFFFFFFRNSSSSASEWTSHPFQKNH